MSSTSSDEDFFLLESVSLKKSHCKKATHEINVARRVYGEYHHLFPDLRKDRKRFSEYVRMQVETFDYILTKVESRLMKMWCNLHTQPILPEERLVVCLR